MEIVIVEISPKAELSVRVEGVAGPGCQSLTAGLEAALGRTRSQTPTSDFYQEAPADAGLGAGRR